MAEQTIVIMILVASVLALLVACPSQARMWEAVENYAGDRKHAHLLIAARPAARRAAGKRVEVRAEALLAELPAGPEVGNAG